MKLYRKIDIYALRGREWQYMCSTSQSRTLKDAKARFIAASYAFTTANESERGIKCAYAAPLERNKFRTARGFLTSYAHACGYLDAASIGADANAITMGKDGLYFVKMAPTADRPRVWECFDGPNPLIDARRFFMGLIRQYKAIRKVNR